MTINTSTFSGIRAKNWTISGRIGGHKSFLFEKTSIKIFHYVRKFLGKKVYLNQSIWQMYAYLFHCSSLLLYFSISSSSPSSLHDSIDTNLFHSMPRLTNCIHANELMHLAWKSLFYGHNSISLSTSISLSSCARS